MKTKITCILLFAVSFPSYAAQETIERTLNLIQQVYELEPKDCNKLQVVNPNEKKIRAGEILFTSTLLSGNRDISCKACHLDKFNSTDGLPLAVGVGGQGEGNYRLEHGEGVMVQRNALSLVGRGTAHFTKFFWDGKVDKADTGEI